MNLSLKYFLFLLSLLFVFTSSLKSDVNDGISFLEQNWNEEDRQWFYHADQGSRLMPYDIFMSMEQSDNEKLFHKDENLNNYGFISGKKTKLNPEVLPIGFTKSKNKVGLTCAACHTQQITYNNSVIRIDGGQSMIDLQSFLLAIESSMLATLNDDKKYQRFEQRILGSNAIEQEKVELKERFIKTYNTRKENNRRNNTDVAYGYTRLDAFGAILNKGLLLTGEKDNFNSPNAPTSYPYLWDTPQHDYVEWNGSQSNSNVGALARNVGEVIGVFGEVETKPKKFIFIDAGYESSIQAKNLRKLEKKIAKLHSPLWPESFPKINISLAEEGKALYQQYCSSCHQDINRTDPKRHIKVRMSTLAEIKTDPLMATNALTQMGKTGIFESRPRFYKKGNIMGKEEPALNIVNNIMIGVLTNNPLQSYLAKRDATKLGHSEKIHSEKYVDGEIIEHGKEVSEEALLAYKARPLNGVWSSAPYLHNGSVPNLYELLLPAEQRSKSFYIGSIEYDPLKVGYVSEDIENAFYFDTKLKGNSNAGHEYGSGYDGLPSFNDKQRWALLEYLKTL